MVTIDGTCIGDSALIGVWGCCPPHDPCQHHLHQRAEGWKHQHAEQVKIQENLLGRIKELEEENYQLAKQNKELLYCLRDLKALAARMEGWAIKK